MSTEANSERELNNETNNSIKSSSNIRRGLRSDMMQDVVSSKPDIIIRWGTTFFLLILCFLFVVCWFVKYPDIVHASAKLTSINAPKPVVSLINGKLIKLNITENQIVNKGQILGYIESTASHKDVIQLSLMADSVQALINNNNINDIRKYFNNNQMHLGELQASYQTFSQSFFLLCDYLSNGFYLKKKAKLFTDINNLARLHKNLIEQKSLQVEDLSLTQKTFNANETLVNSKVISDFDYRNEQSKFINKKLILPQINSSIINNESQQNEKEKEIMELENTIMRQKLIFQQALSTFKSQIDDWIKRYTLSAPVKGRVAFASFVQEDQQLHANETICFINPENSQYFAEVIIPQANFGKVALHQQVLLKFQSYPFQEYGSVKGRIEFISHIPIENGYLAKVSLTNKLNTTYGKQIQYRDGLLA